MEEELALSQYVDQDPPSRWLKNVQEIPFPDALRLLFGMADSPPDRPDIRQPDEDDYQTICTIVREKLPKVRSKLDANLDLSDDQCSVLMAYTMEHPYPMYRLLNAWMICDRRDPEVVKHVAPLALLMITALERLPTETVQAARAVTVAASGKLRDMFNHHAVRCVPGSPVNFWGFSSFSTDDAVASGVFGSTSRDTIIFKCPELKAVRIGAFSLSPMDEHEVLPVPPAMFHVVCPFKHAVIPNLFITIRQIDNAQYCYSVPRRKPTCEQQSTRTSARSTDGDPSNDSDSWHDPQICDSDAEDDADGSGSVSQDSGSDSSDSSETKTDGLQADDADACDAHHFIRKQCMVCSMCNLCTGYGEGCVHHTPGRKPGEACGCGSGESGCQHCGACQECTVGLRCPRRSNAWSCGVKEGKFILQNKSQHLLVCLDKDSNGWWDYEHNGKGMVVWSAGTPNARDFPGDLPSAYETLSAQVFGDWEIVAHGSEWHVKHDGNPKPIILLPLGLQYAPGGGSQCECIVNVLRMSGRRNGDGHCGSGAEDDGSGSVSQDSGSGSSDSSETKTDGLQADDADACDAHHFIRKQCMVCSMCNLCTGYGEGCVHHTPGRKPGEACGCGPGESGCQHCGACQECTVGLRCPRRSNAWSCGVKGGKFILQNKSQHLLVRLPNGSNGWWNYEHDGKGMKVWSSGSSNPEDFPCDLPSTYETLSAQVFGGWEIVAHGSEWHVKHDGNPKPIILLPLGLQYAPGGGSQCECIVNVLRMSGRRNGDGHCASDAEDDADGSGSVSQDSGSGSSDSSETKTDGLQADDADACDAHHFIRKQCMVCSMCNLCTGYGEGCVHHTPGRKPGEACGCGSGESGCQHCGACQECTVGLRCPRRSNAWSCGVKEGKFILQNKSQHLLVRLSNGSNGWWNYEHDGKGMKVWSAGTPNARDFPGDLPSAYETLSAQVFGDWEIVAHGSEWHVKHDGNPKPIILLPLGLQYAPGGGSQCECIVNVLRMSGRRNGDGHCASDAEDDADGSGSVSQDSGSGSSDSSETKTDGLQADDADACDAHHFIRKQCMVCSMCNLCTGYGEGCVHHTPGRKPGEACGCGSGESGCQHCGACQECTVGLRCPRRSNAWSCGVKEGKFILQNKSQHLLVCLDKDSNGWWDYEHNGKGMVVWSAGTPNARDFPGDLPSAYETLSAQVFGDWEIVAHGSEWHVKHDGNPKPIILLPLGLQYAPGGGSQCECIVNVLRMSGRRNGDGHCGSGAEDDGSGSVSQDSGSGSSDSSETKTDGLQADDADACDAHHFIRKQCMVCSMCNLCTGYGEGCVHHTPGRKPGEACGCGSGESGCQHCGACQECTVGLRCPRRSNAWSCGVKGGKFILQNKSQHLLVRLPNGSNGWWNYEHDGKGMKVWSSGSSNPEDFPCDLPSAYETLSAQVFGGWEIVAHGSEWHVKHDGNPKPIILLPLGLQYAPGGGSQCECIVNVLRMSGRRNGDGHCASDAEDDADGSGSVSQDSGSGSSDSSETKTDGLQADDADACDAHHFIRKQCMVCSMCNLCTGYGEGCVHHTPGRKPGEACGCGSGESGCQHCGACQECTVGLRCPRRSNAWSCGVKEGKFILQNKSQHLLVCLDKDSNGWWNYEHKGKGIVVWSAGSSEPQDFPGDLPSAYETLSAQVFGDWEIVAGSGWPLIFPGGLWMVAVISWWALDGY